MNENIKNCRCGGQAELEVIHVYDEDKGRNRKYQAVQCDECNMCSYQAFDFNAIQCWNKCMGEPMTPKLIPLADALPLIDVINKLYRWYKEDNEVTELPFVDEALSAFRAKHGEAP